MPVSYEWDALEMTNDGENADVVEHYHCDTLADAVAVSRGLSYPLIQLVRYRGNAHGELTDRQWITVERARLLCEFEDGSVVPKRFHDECRSVWPRA